MGLLLWLGRVFGFGPGEPKPLDSTTEPYAAELAETLSALIAILDADGDTHWKAWMQQALEHIHARDLRGVEHLLNAYGGMGSFNDLIIGQRVVGDQTVWSDDASSTNDQLDALRGRAYGLASAIRDAHCSEG